jgi:hypothetical protein
VQGDIPQVFSTYYFLNDFQIASNSGLRATRNRDCSNLLPVFVVPNNISDPQNLLSYGTFQCPSLTLSNTPRSSAELDPSYYAYELCNCVPGWFGLHSRCLSCSVDTNSPGQPFDSIQSCSGGQKLKGRFYTGGVLLRDNSTCLAQELPGILAPCLRADSVCLS